MQVWSAALKAKLRSNPWKKLRQVFKFKLRRPIFKSFRFRKLQRRRAELAAGKISITPRKRRIRRFFSVFRRREPAEEMDQVGEVLPEVGRQGREPILFPSPITPAYLKRGRGQTISSSTEEAGRGDVNEIRKSNVEDACRSFQNYLAEMIVEERHVKDLMDVEELLYCWKNLRSPVFHDLVCRFYGELCMDLFSGENEETVDSRLVTI